jgi:hypothetical protein
MTKDVSLNLDEFSRHALERFARRGEESAAKAVRAASLYYLSDRDAHRPAWKVPDFALEEQPGHRLKVELDDQTWDALKDEAADQGVSVETLAVHAVMYFLADVDSGRVGAQLRDALDRTDQ